MPELKTSRGCSFSEALDDLLLGAGATLEDKEYFERIFFSSLVSKSLSPTTECSFKFVDVFIGVFDSEPTTF